MTQSAHAPEIEAMHRVGDALSSLDFHERKRVMDWARDRFGTDAEFAKLMTETVQKFRSRNAEMIKFCKDAGVDVPERLTSPVIAP